MTMQKTLVAATMMVALIAGTASADTTADTPPADATASTATETTASTGADTATGTDVAEAPAPVLAPALPTKTGLHLALTAGLSFGGDTLAEATFTNGDSEKLKAGGLFYFAVGPSIEFANSPWSVQALFGRHLDSITATNAELTFERNTMELQVFHRAGPHRLGLGYVKHLSPEYQESGAFILPSTVQFKDATGLSLEYNWMPVGSKVGLSLRAVKIDYEAESLNGMPVTSDSISGNHVAAGIYVYL